MNLQKIIQYSEFSPNKSRQIKRFSQISEDENNDNNSTIGGTNQNGREHQHITTTNNNLANIQQQ